MPEFSENEGSIFTKQGSLFPAVNERELPQVQPILWERLARSEFRQQFHLNAQDRSYLATKGFEAVLEHGADFIGKRLAPAHPAKDGRQTPWQGHPVFVAQHATGTCCRSCLEKWHGFVKGLPLNGVQQAYVLAVIATWLRQEQHRPAPKPGQNTKYARAFGRKNKKLAEKT
ncbi:DUF4186 domain-containing protein [Acetobacter orientalis]|uniref:DUF4186 domain-containing protein n=1 Tax=Acetobacter orientalis TaxID=146474 RepID=UPI00211AEE29|nr:DUF4186 domain-containing protein [Acetobacter orientalis]